MGSTERDNITQTFGRSMFAMDIVIFVDPRMIPVNTDPV